MIGLDGRVCMSDRKRQVRYRVGSKDKEKRITRWDGVSLMDQGGRLLTLFNCCVFALPIHT
jgi:hypothetical protein